MTLMETTREKIQPVPHPSVDERAARGREARKRVPRSSLGAWEPPTSRRDPVGLLHEQETTRVPELVQIRHERMLASPFAFFRGAAVVMAADVASGPKTGLVVQCCGDAHLANFGGFASPDRSLVFDINDFDETSVGPFEWDMKRLAASFQIAARSREFTDDVTRAIVQGSANAYREAIRGFAAMKNLDVWYARLDLQGAMKRYRQRLSPAEVARVERTAAKAERRDSLRAFDKLAHTVDGEVRITSDPPLLVPADELTDADAEQLRGWVHERFQTYRRSLQPDRRHLLESFRLVDLARKVVGVGSVGTRCWIALLLGKDGGDPLFLQIKEAEASVLEPYGGKSPYANHGQRVVEGQRLLQAASDILLGHLVAESPEDGIRRDFYVRQLWDWKLSADLETMPPGLMKIYGEICGWTLARAHARSGDRIAIAAYLGSGDVFDRAIADFAVAYADQNERDYEAARRTLATP
jgi:uncharacterized protein (DUF2252 family)